MAEEESRNAIQKDDRRSSLPAVRREIDFDVEEVKLKLQYFGWAAVPSGVLLEILGAQFPGLALAAGAGVAAAYFSREIHYVIEPGLRVAGDMMALLTRGSSGRASYRLMDRDWWMGQEAVQYADDEEEDLEEDEDLLVEGSIHKEVVLGRDLVVPAEDLAGKAIFIAGIRRSGKTNLGVRMAEELSVYNLPLFVPDLEGDWLSAASTSFQYGRVLGHPSVASQYSDIRDFVSVTLETARTVGYDILEDGAQAVLDMSSFETVDEACKVATEIIRGLFIWTEEHPDDRVPCQIYLDEAQRFLPENLDESIIQDRLIRLGFLKAYMDVIAVGGKRGLSPVILTQRFSQVNKKIMAQSEVFFLFRQTMDNDLKRCAEFVNASTATAEQISKFAQGVGVYISALGEQIVTQFLKRHSDGRRGSTPTVDAADRYKKRRAGRETIQVDRDLIPRPVVQRPVVQLEQFKSEDELLLEKGVEEYKAGATSLDKLMAALDITQHKARQLKPKIEVAIQKQQQMDAVDNL